MKTKNFFPSSRNRVFRDRVESDYFLLVNVVKENNWARGGASGGARSSDVKLIGKSVTRPRRSSLLLASGKREDPVIIFEDEEDGEELLRQITRK